MFLDNTRLAEGFAKQAAGGRPLPAIALWQLQNLLRSVSIGGTGYPVTNLLEHIRRLVILADERELRELPVAAQTLDAVRLMTIHSSKGLEFEVLHLPSLTKASLPSPASRNRALPPPDGMVEGAPHCGKEVLWRGHEEEQECLFFVALSRAEDRLILYAPARQANGRRQSRSPYVDRIAVWLDTQDPFAASNRLAATYNAVDISFQAPLRLTPSKLALYDRCPRRFLYTHLLKLGGRRTETAFMKMHSAVQATVEDLVRSEAGTLTETEVDTLFQRHWAELGPTNHGYADSYERAARRLIAFLTRLRAAETPEPAESLVLDVGDAQVIVRPDERIRTRDGRLVLRRIRTGHLTSTATDKLDAAAYQLAADTGDEIEFVFLSDQHRAAVSMSERKLKTRRERIESKVAAIQAGEFPAEPDSPSRTCPRCPYFFICTQPPAGALTEIFLADLPVAHRCGD